MAGGISPAWPISLTDLAPYYAEGRGRSGRCTANRGDDPTEEGTEGPYAYAAVHDDPGIASLRTHWQAQGWRPFSLPLGIKLDQAHPVTSTCIKCKTCGGYPCLPEGQVGCAHDRHRADHETCPMSPLLTGRKVDAAGDRRGGQDGDRGGLPDRAGRGALDGRHRGAGGGRGQHGRRAAGVSQRGPSERPRQRLRPGGAQLHVPHAVGPWSA